MAVAVGDLIVPYGELQPAQFPDRNLDESVQVWLTQIEESGDLDDLTTAAADRARTAFVYWRAFTTIADRLANTPETQRSSDRSTTWSTGQIAYWRRRADEQRIRYEAELAADTDTDSTQIGQSTAAAATFTW